MTFTTIGQVIRAPEAIKAKIRHAEQERAYIQDERGDWKPAPRNNRASFSAHAARRTGEPVRRNSQSATSGIPHYRERISKADARKIVIAATIYDRTARENGKRVLGRTAIQILEFLANLAAYSGRVEPSYRYIMEQVGCCKDSITRALKSLRAHGFLDWVRRYLPTGQKDGPQVKQTTNAYRIKLPALAKRLLARKKETSPIPDDVEWEAIQRARAIEAMRATLTVREQLAMDLDDPAMAELMARIWEGIQRNKCDPENAAESALPSFNSMQTSPMKA